MMKLNSVSIIYKIKYFGNTSNTNIISKESRYYSTKDINEVRQTIDYILKPILQVENKLLAPIIFTEITRETIEIIEDINKMLIVLPNNNLVKIYLKKELELENSVEIIPKLNPLSKNILNVIKETPRLITANNFSKERIFNSINSNIEIKQHILNLSYCYGNNLINNTIRDEYSYNNSKNLFILNKNDIIYEIQFVKNEYNKYKYSDLSIKLNREERRWSIDNYISQPFNILNPLTDITHFSSVTPDRNIDSPGCYLIFLNNNYYFYIGSSVSILDRLNLHFKNISKLKNLSKTFEFHILTELEIKNFINIKFSPIYYIKDYLKNFKLNNPNYLISKGEWILLNKLTDLYLKILEQSLISKFNPLLNTQSKIVFKNWELNESDFKNYNNLDMISKENEKKKYKLVVSKYDIYMRVICNKPDCKITGNCNYVQKYFSITKRFPEAIKILGNTDKILKYKYDDGYCIKLLNTLSLKSMFSKYNLKSEEVLLNLNKYHKYEGSSLITELKIIKH